MTLTTTTQKLIYTGNGSLTEFAYTWLINTNTDLKVYLRTIATGAETLQTLTTHYSVSGVGSAGGGNVTFVSAPADTLQIVIVRAVPLTQDTDYVSNDSFPAETHEAALDTLMMAVQDQAEVLDRSIKLSPTNVMTSTEFTQSAADRASKVLAFDSSGELSVTQELGTLTGNWAASTAYVIRDLIKDTSNNNIYFCNTAHTSSGSQPISSNTDSAKWDLIVDAASATTSAAAAVVSAQLADDYAVKTSGAVTGTDYSSKAWSVGGTGVTTTSSRGAAKEWATTTGGAVDTSEYSAKEYALGTTVAAGSAKDWAVLAEDSAVTGSSYSALHHAAKGAASATAAASSATSASSSATTSTNYATKVDGAVTGTDFSSKAWAVGGTDVTDTSSRGAAKEWAIEAEDNTVAGAGTYSALHYSAKASTSATAAASSATSAAASSAASSAAGLDYVYSTTTADADPGTGVIRFNHATLSSATAAYMDDTDANSVDVSTYLLTWDDSTTTALRGTVKMVKSGTPSTYALYNITGASTDASGYVKLALTHVASNGTFSNSDTVIIHNTRTGNTGSFSEGAVDLNGEKLTLDANANTSIHASTDDQIDIEIAGADDFRFTANTFSVLSGSTLNIDSGASIVNSGTATNFGVDPESAYAGVLQTNANFVDQVIFGPSVDGVAWNGAWSKASVFSSLMLATIEDEGSNTEINIWDLTEQSAGAISTTPLATVDLSAAATPTAIAACMGYLIVSSEDGIAIIDPHSGAWAERTVGWPRTLSTSTTPALTDNSVSGVSANVWDSWPLDPRTGGTMPCFGIEYSTGADTASIIKYDGTVYDRSGATSATTSVGIAGGRILIQKSGVVQASPLIDTIVADDWNNTDIQNTGAAPYGLSADTGMDATNNFLAAADATGATFTYPVYTSGISNNAVVTRTYNTGYMVGDIRGAWLANSKTADRSYKANTLTENGTVTEAVVETSAELLGYSGFSTSNYLSRANDSDYNAFGTGSAYLSCWFKTTSNNSTQMFAMVGSTPDNERFNLSLQSDGTLRGIDDGATAATTIISVAVYDDAVWHKADFVRISSTERYLYADGVLIGSDTTDAGSLTATVTFRIGLDTASSPIAPADESEISLVRLSATVPTATQIRQMYDAEKGMFIASAECLLQSGSTDAVIDVNVDPLSGKVLVTQTDAITIFDGLVVDSKPTVNSGTSEKGKLWGDLRAEQNSANAYVTAPATDQRQVNEMVRGLASDLPKGVDLSKAKAWATCTLSSGTLVIRGSYNIKSMTDNGVGDIRDITFGVPFKSNFAVATSGGNTIVGPLTDAGSRDVLLSGDQIGRLSLIAHDGSAVDGSFYFACFGELENE